MTTAFFIIVMPALVRSPHNVDACSQYSTPIRAPHAYAVCERFLGSVRRECLDHLLILQENQRRRVLRAYCASFNTARPHQGIGQAIPATIGQVGTPAAAAPVVSIPVLGGLHHDYRRAA